jgi:hypothetical protein
MFQRGIGWDAVLAVVAHGQVVVEYADDMPYPSQLLLGFVDARPLHVVAAIDDLTGTCIVVTAYQPRPEQWGADFRSRRTE